MRVGRLAGRWWNAEQLTRTGQVIGAPSVGEQPVVTNAVQALGQNMEEKAADEFGAGERHGFGPITALAAIVFVAESDSALIMSEQSTIGDGDPMGIARQIAQYGIGAGEGTLGVDDPVGALQRHEPVAEGLGIAECAVGFKKAQLIGAVKRLKPAQEQAPKQPREHPHGQEKARLTTVPLSLRANAGAKV